MRFENVAIRIRYFRKTVANTISINEISDDRDTPSAVTLIRARTPI